MTAPRPVRFRGVVEGEILEVTHVEIDCPLIGTEILVTKDGKVYVSVDGKPTLTVHRGGILSLCDQRTDYIHSE